MELIILTLFLLFLFAGAGDSRPSAYEALKSYDFPVGLLPEGVTGYDLDPSTGEFSAHLKATCSFKLSNNYEMKYSTTIKGVISKDKLEKLEGVKVKVAVVWLSITEVKRDAGELEFSVGVAAAKFPVTNFEECPRCGCGLECGDWKES